MAYSLADIDAEIARRSGDAKPQAASAYSLADIDAEIAKRMQAAPEPMGWGERAMDIARGTVEVPLAAATGAIGGLAGLAGSIATTPFMGPEYGKELRKFTTGMYGYQPESETGKQAMNILGTVTAPLSWPRKIAESIGGEQWGNVADVAMLGLGAKGVKPAAKIASEGIAPAIAETTGKLAEETLGRTAKWRTTLPVEEQRALSNTMFKNRLSFTEEGVEKHGMAIDKLENQLTKEIKPIRGNKIPIKTIGDKVKTELIAQVAEDSPTRNADITNINNLVTEWEESAGKVAEGEIPGDVAIGRLQNLKRALYGKLQGTYDATGKATLKTDVYKGIARVAKETIEAESAKAGRGDRIKSINAEMGELLKLDPHLNRATNRIGNHNYFGLPEYLSAGAGAAVGGVLGAEGALFASKVARSPGIQTKLAQELYDISKRFGEPEKPIPAPRGLHETIPYEPPYPLYPWDVAPGAIPKLGAATTSMTPESMAALARQTRMENAAEAFKNITQGKYAQESAQGLQKAPELYPAGRYQQRALQAATIEGLQSPARLAVGEQASQILTSPAIARKQQKVLFQQYGIETEIRQASGGNWTLVVTKNPLREGGLQR